MALVRKVRLTNVAYGTEFFNSFENEYINGYIENNIPCVSVGDTLTVKDYIDNNISVWVGDTQVIWINRYWSTPITTVACDENIAYIHFQSVWNSTPWDLSVLVLYHKIDDSLTVYSYHSGNASGAVENLTLYAVNTQSQYQYKSSISGYSTEFGYLDWTEKKLFIGGTTKTNIVVPSLIDCSTVAEKNIITFGAKNYYSMGTNTLIQFNY